MADSTLRNDWDNSMIARSFCATSRESLLSCCSNPSILDCITAFWASTGRSVELNEVPDARLVLGGRAEVLCNLLGDHFAILVPEFCRGRFIALGDVEELRGADSREEVLGSRPRRGGGRRGAEAGEEAFFEVRSSFAPASGLSFGKPFRLLWAVPRPVLRRAAAEAGTWRLASAAFP